MTSEIDPLVHRHLRQSANYTVVEDGRKPSASERSQAISNARDYRKPVFRLRYVEEQRRIDLVPPDMTIKSGSTVVEQKPSSYRPFSLIPPTK
ncbi:MAG: hypothetical protein Q7S45_02985 [Candidatus Curtissbacteria bacterium]|nr:hypothetical protein [Candidatus Curtissbacteria bacterium]